MKGKLQQQAGISQKSVRVGANEAVNVRVDFGKADVARLEAAAKRWVERHALEHGHRVTERNHAEIRVHANQTGAPQLGGRVRLRGKQQ